MRIRSVAAVLLAASLLLAGCSSDPLAQQYRDGSGKGYIAGSGVTELAPGKRGDPVHFSGTTASGKKFSSTTERGTVLVVNFWYADCAPCRVEAKDLEKISRRFDGKGAAFVGVNTQNQAATARSFDENFGVTYPSIIDANSGAVQLAFSGEIRPNATPTTLVLDKKGRVAARIEGPISAQPSTLVTLIRDTIDEGD